MKTWWCTKCNRFAIAPNKIDVPACPVHGYTMIDKRDDFTRYKRFSKYMNQTTRSIYDNFFDKK